MRLNPFAHFGLVALLSTLVACHGGGGGGGTGSVISPPSGLSYPSPQIYVVAQPIAPLIPAVTGSASTWTVTPALPQGLSLNPTTGAITGTPAKSSAVGAYTITAANQGGSVSTTLTLTVNDTKPAVAYPSTVFGYTTEIPITPITPTSTGGAVTTWSINPALPPGLSLGATDGTISGTPTAATPAASYTVTAANSAGATTATVQLGVESDMLLDLGHTVTEAQSGSHALKLLESDAPFDVVVTDYAMPGMNGLELAQRIKGTHPRLPIVLATGYAELPADRSIEFGQLSKPYKAEELAAALAKAVSF